MKGLKNPGESKITAETLTGNIYSEVATRKIVIVQQSRSKTGQPDDSNIHQVI